MGKMTMLRKKNESVEVFCPHCGDLITVEVVIHLIWKGGETHAMVDPSASGLSEVHVCKKGKGSA